MNATPKVTQTVLLFNSSYFKMINITLSFILSFILKNVPNKLYTT